jgi:hypothetical protein
MALERRNPLPMGRYWVDIQAKYVPEFDAFLRTVSRGIMVFETKERVDPFHTTGGNTGYLFEVKDPLVYWDHTKFGYPTIATGITSLDDTGQVPTPEPLIPPDLLSAGEGFGKAALILGALWLLSQM